MHYIRRGRSLCFLVHVVRVCREHRAIWNVLPFLFRASRLGPAPDLSSDWLEVSHQIQRARARRDAAEKWPDKSDLFQYECAIGVESVARIAEEREGEQPKEKRNNWSLSAMVGDHTISGDSALTQRSKNGLSCKMVLQAVGKVLR